MDLCFEVFADVAYGKRGVPRTLARGSGISVPRTVVKRRGGTWLCMNAFRGLAWLCIKVRKSSKERGGLCSGRRRGLAWICMNVFESSKELGGLAGSRSAAEPGFA